MSSGGDLAIPAAVPGTPGLSSSANSTIAAIGPPKKITVLDPVSQVYSHTPQHISLPPTVTSSRDKEFVVPNGSLPGFGCSAEFSLDGFDVVKRQLRIDYVAEINIPDPWVLLPDLQLQLSNASDPSTWPANGGVNYSDLQRLVPVSDYISIYPDAINRVLDCKVYESGTRITTNDCHETWLANSAGMTEEVMKNRTTFAGRDEVPYGTYQLVNQSNLMSGALSIGSQAGKAGGSQRCLYSDAKQAVFLCHDYVMNGLFLPEGDALVHQGLTGLSRLKIDLAFKSNLRDMLRIIAPVHSRILYENAGGIAAFYESFNQLTVTIREIRVSIETTQVPAAMATTKTIAYRPYTAIVADYLPITSVTQVGTGGRNQTWLQAANLPANQYPLSSRVQRIECAVQFEHLMIAVVPANHNQGIFSVTGSPFTITNLSISTSQNPKQLTNFKLDRLADITEKNGAWFPSLKWNTSNTDAIIDGTLAGVKDIMLRANGNFVILKPGDFSTSRPTTPGLMAPYTISLDVGICAIDPVTFISVNPADYRLMVLQMIPSMLSTRSRVPTLQLGLHSSPDFANAVADLVRNPENVVTQLTSFGEVTLPTATSLTASGGSIGSWIKGGLGKLRDLFGTITRNIMADPRQAMGALNAGKNLFGYARDLTKRPAEGPQGGPLDKMQRM